MVQHLLCLPLLLNPLLLPVGNQTIALKFSLSSLSFSLALLLLSLLSFLSVYVCLARSQTEEITV